MGTHLKKAFMIPLLFMLVSMQCQPTVISKNEENFIQNGLLGLFIHIHKSPYHWILLQPNQIQSAQEGVINQSNDLMNSVWSCGPNSMARAMYLLGGKVDEKAYGDLCDRLASPLSMFNIGISPHNLAERMTQAGYLPAPYQYATLYSYSSFHDCAKAIKADIQQGKPVIIFLLYAIHKFHYETVIALAVDENENPQEFVTLNTNQALYLLDKETMCNLMRNDYKIITDTLKGSIGTYNIIRFH